MHFDVLYNKITYCLLQMSNHNKSYWKIVSYLIAYWRHMVTRILVNIGSGNGLWLK